MIFDDKAIEKKLSSLLNLTSSSHDLIKKLLKVNPEERLSASEALKHEFFRDLQPQKQ